MDELVLGELISKLFAALAHPATTVFGLAIGVWGLVVTLRSRRLVKGYFSSRYGSWLHNATKYDGLAITYRGEAVQQIGATEVAFWNGGNQTIRFEDFSKDFPLRIEIVGSVRIFESEILNKAPDSLTVKLGADVSPNALTDDSIRSLPIEFEFFEPLEGVKVKLVHDGGHQAQINIAGRLAGAGSVERLDNTGFGAVVGSTKEKFFMSQAVLVLGGIGLYCVYRIFTGDWRWWHGWGTMLSIYLFVLPGLMFAKILPKGLQNR